MVVYKAKFPNGKVYVGKTKNFEDRKLKHYYSPRYYKTKMANAIFKHGFDSIIWEVLFESDDSKIIDEKEKQLIIEFNSIENGYNISLGGDGGDTISKNPNKNDIMKSQLKSKNSIEYVIITDELGELIKSDYTSGNHGVGYISKKYKISKQRITRFLQREGIELDKNRSSKVNSFVPSQELIDRVISFYKEGKTINQISEIEDLTILIVSRILHDSGVRKSKRFNNGKRYDGRQPKSRKLNN
jgi:hypothetical protein